MTFNDIAEDYESVMDACVGGDSRYYLEVKADFLLRLTRRSPPRAVLDFGCGTGRLAHILADRLPTTRVDGFDPSSKSIDCAQRAARSNNRFNGNLDALGQDYDLAVVCNVLHHVPPPERDGVLARLWDCLAPGGRLTVIEHNPLNPLSRWVVAHCPFDHDAILLGASETQTRLRRLGRIERKDYITFLPERLSALNSVERLLGWLPLGAQYGVTAIKRL